LRRIGKKKQPQYRLVVAEAAAPRDGRFIEAIGHYNPRVDPPAISVKQERALAWLRQGAQPSDTAKSILVKTGVWEQFTGEPPPTGPPAPAPAVEAAEPAPAAEAAEPAAAVEAAEPAPAVEAAEPAPAVEAAEPASAVEAAEPAPAVEAAEPTPAVEAAEPAPAVEAAESADEPVVMPDAEVVADESEEGEPEPSREEASDQAAGGLDRNVQ
jgi:small subunit ribosomal protein S16